MARTKLKASSNQVGINKINIVARVHKTGLRLCASQPNSRSRKVAGSTRLRRKLSRIFQREPREIGLATWAPDSSGTYEKIHPAICQSPRSQRCLRRLWAL